MVVVDGSTMITKKGTVQAELNFNRFGSQAHGPNRSGEPFLSLLRPLSHNASMKKTRKDEEENYTGRWWTRRGRPFAIGSVSPGRYPGSLSGSTNSNVNLCRSIARIVIASAVANCCPRLTRQRIRKE